MTEREDSSGSGFIFCRLVSDYGKSACRRIRRSARQWLGISAAASQRISTYTSVCWVHKLRPRWTESHKLKWELKFWRDLLYQSCLYIIFACRLLIDVVLSPIA